MKTYQTYSVASVFCLLVVCGVFCLADPHPVFTAKYLREKSDLIAVCRVIEFVRIDRVVDTPDHQKAYDIIVEVEDLLKGDTSKTRIPISHLRQSFANRIPVDFGDQINERLARLDFGEVLDVSRDRVFMLAYLQNPLLEQGPYFPTSTNDWEIYSLHVLSGRFN